MNKKSYEKMLQRQAKELAIMQAKVEQYNKAVDDFVFEIRSTANSINANFAIKDDRLIKFAERACRVLINSKYDKADFE